MGSTTTTPAAASAVSAATASTTKIMLPNSGAKLPTEKVTYRWIESGAPFRNFWPPFIEAYQRAHPNITIQYDNVTDVDLAKIVPLAIQNGNAQDVFRIPPGISGAQAVREGWAAPLDDIMPNFAGWKGTFPPNSFLEGTNVFNGKTYSFPLLGNFHSVLLMYNVDDMQRAGYDAGKPFSWDEFRTVVKKMTQQGNGRYYGLLIGGADPAQWSSLVTNLGAMAGAAGGEFNWKTGQYNYTSDQFLAGIDLVLGLKADGSFFPGSINLKQQEAIAQMPAGVAGMFLALTGSPATWVKEYPAFKFDIGPGLVPPSGTFLPLPGAPPTGFWFRYAKSKYPEITADIFTYLGSEEGQRAFLSLSGGSVPVAYPQANQTADLDPRIRKAFGWFQQQMRIAPSVLVRNPDAAQVALEQRPVTPDLGTTIQGIFSGQLSDPKKAMQDLQDRADKELDRAIKAAQAKGAKVSRDDYVFPNWDPTKDYTAADYAALKK